MSDGAAQDATRLRADLAALRDGAALSSLDDQALLAARGDDRTSFLQGMLTNDVARLVPGQGTYALLLTEQGRPVAELVVLALRDALWLETAAAARPRVREALERYVVADDVELEDVAACGLALRGPRARELLAAAAPAHAAAIEALGECEHVEIEHGGATHHALRTRDACVDAFHVWSADAAARDALAETLRARGACRVGDDALEVQRIVAGWARSDVDYGPQTLAAEIPSFGRAVSYRKGCYLGQEVMERVAARGHVNWLLVRLTADPASSFSAGARVKDGDDEVGRVTSVARPPDGGAAALARVRAAVAETGRRLVVEDGGGTVPVVLTTIPVQE
ncbi:MAG: hypothetical protein AB1689_27910 [Thermodesulfobacteriota bacterium]